MLGHGAQGMGLTASFAVSGRKNFSNSFLSCPNGYRAPPPAEGDEASTMDINLSAGHVARIPSVEILRGDAALSSRPVANIHSAIMPNNFLTRHARPHHTNPRTWG